MLIGIEETLFALSSALETAPDTITEALAGPNAEQWKEAWKSKLDQLQNIGVWKLIPRPKDKPVILCREVLHEKHAANGSVSRRKVRIATGGHRQIENVNYTDTFTSVAKIVTIPPLAVDYLLIVLEYCPRPNANILESCPVSYILAIIQGNPGFQSTWLPGQVCLVWQPLGSHCQINIQKRTVSTKGKSPKKESHQISL
jgi:hypothetical protein